MKSSSKSSKWVSWVCVSLVGTSFLCFGTVDEAQGGAAAVTAQFQGTARASGVLAGPENGRQEATDNSPWGDFPKDAGVTLDDSGRVLQARANVNSTFDYAIEADSVNETSPDNVYGAAGPDDPFVTPIVPIPGLPGFASLAVSDGNIGIDAVTFSGIGDYNGNGFLELSVLDVGPLASLEEVANIVIGAGSVEKAIALGSLPDDVGVLGKWRETDLSPEIGPFEFDFSVGLPDGTGPENIMMVSVSHAVPEPSSAVLALLALTLLFSRARLANRRGVGR